MVSDLGGSARDGMVDIATRLFAELGFDGVSGALIAQAAGISTAELTRVYGSKYDLYRAVMARAHEIEETAIAGRIKEFTPTAANLDELIDAYLDFCVAHPEIVALWKQRSLGDAADTTDLEKRYIRPRVMGICEALRPYGRPDNDVDYAVWTVLWAIYGFVGEGLWHGRCDIPTRHRGGGIGEADLAGFRHHLHLLMRFFVPLPG